MEGSSIVFTNALTILLFDGRLVSFQGFITGGESEGTMRRLAVISDIHANLEAMEAGLAQIGGEEIVCLGDQDA